MKRTKTIKAAALLCIINSALFVGCTTDDTATGGNDGRAELRLSSGLTVQEVSRASTSLQSTAFAADEKIDVFIYEDATTATTKYGTNGKLTYTANGSDGLTTYNADNTENKQYWPASGNGVNIYAFYPSGKVSDATSTDGVTFTVNTDQSPDANYKASDLMYGAPESNPVARTSNAVNLQFSHKLAKVTITLTAGAGSPNLAGAMVQLLGVQPTIAISSIDKSNLTFGDLGSDATQNITVIDDKTTSSTLSTLSGSCIVPPQTLPTQFIMVKLASGGVFLGGLGSAPELKSGNEYKYEITVNKTGLELEGCTIREWNEIADEAEHEAEMNLLETLKAKYGITQEVDLSSLSENTTVSGTVMLTGKVENKTITVADDATVLLYNANITTSSGSAIKCDGDATIYLEGENTATTSAKEKCGIEAGPENTNLTIDGDGSLEVKGGMDGAGIGSGYQSSCGNITINSGTVTATGDYFSAGIGSGDHGASCGNITISGGTVKADGVTYGAGIGSGYASSSCGDITISGGTVTATGDYCSAGIGSGYSSSSCGDITISGGTVTATGKYKGAGIGSGYQNSSCGDITISGGTVTADGGTNGAGIGSGENAKCQNITITSSVEKVTVSKGENAEYIGLGYGGSYVDSDNKVSTDDAKKKIYKEDGKTLLYSE